MEIREALYFLVLTVSLFKDSFFRTILKQEASVSITLPAFADYCEKTFIGVYSSNAAKVCGFSSIYILTLRDLGMIRRFLSGSSGSRVGDRSAEEGVQRHLIESLCRGSRNAGESF